MSVGPENFGSKNRVPNRLLDDKLPRGSYFSPQEALTAAYGDLHIGTPYPFSMLVALGDTNHRATDPESNLCGKISF